MAYVNGINGRRTVTCRNCWQLGHNKRHCPTLSPDMKEYYAGKGKAKCSWCKETGHNKKTCGKLKTEKAQYISANAEYRRNFLHTLLRHGIGIGSLVKYMREDSYNKDKLYIVTDFEWDGVQQKAPNRRVIYANAVNTQYDERFELPDNGMGWSEPKTLTRRPEDEIKAMVPAGWLDGTSGIDRFFK